jgi:chromosome segregation ATPase
MYAIFLIALVTPTSALQERVENRVQMNPVRKVVNMLQAMQSKVIAEGAKEKELHDKFVCYCNTYSNVELRKECAANRAKIEELTSAIEAGKGELAQLREDLKTHAAEEASAKKAMSEATALREKEAASFAAQDADDKKNIAAIKKAIAAIKKGIESKFLQTSDAQDLQRLFTIRQDVGDDDRKDIIAFLSGQDSNADSNVIIGVLENMLSLMSKNAADAHDAEQAAISEYEQLMMAKSKELKSLQSALETKTAREGELAVKLVDMENDLSDTKLELSNNEKLLTDLDKMCDAKEAEYEMNKKLRSEELEALADTIKILNDDDALELFKKALPPKASSFLQMKVNSRTMRVKALAALSHATTNSEDKLRLNFLTLALKGKKIGFDGIIKMIDEMVVNLQKEQTDDEAKKGYCAKEFDSSEDKKKMEERTIKDLETTMDDTKESISQVKDEMKALEDAIKDTDKEVAEATEQRKEEHAEYTEVMAGDRAAKEVLGFAKNRLNKFYNPSLYVPPPKAELSAEDQIVAGMSETFLQVHRDSPPPPPAAVSAYKKQSNSSTGVIEMIDLLISDLDKEMASHEAEEKESQSDYETVMAQSAEKRKTDAASLDDKESTKADMENQLQKHKNDHKSSEKEYAATLQYIHSLHGECDWLLKYFSVRKEARASEIEALTKAKAILNGADFSLAQTNEHRSLRRFI